MNLIPRTLYQWAASNSVFQRAFSHLNEKGRVSTKTWQPTSHITFSGIFNTSVYLTENKMSLTFHVSSRFKIRKWGCYTSLYFRTQKEICLEKGIILYSLWMVLMNLSIEYNKYMITLWITYYGITIKFILYLKYKIFISVTKTSDAGAMKASSRGVCGTSRNDS